MKGLDASSPYTNIFTMKVTNSDATADLHKRLRRVEGQVRGVQKMLDDERDCREIIQQLNAIQSAVRNASVVFMRTYARDCLIDSAESTAADRTAVADELITLMAQIK